MKATRPLLGRRKKKAGATLAESLRKLRNEQADFPEPHLAMAYAINPETLTQEELSQLKALEASNAAFRARMRQTRAHKRLYRESGPA